MSVPVRPSRLRRGLVRAGPPASVALLALAAVDTASFWPLLFAPLLVPAFVALRRELPVRALEPARDGVRIESPEGVPETLQLRDRPAVSGLAISLPVYRADGRRSVLRIWRDAVSADDYRRLARRVRRLKALPRR